MIKEKTLKEAVQKHKDGMYRLALSLLKSQADAEDVLQDVFIKCWQNRRQIIINMDLGGYLMQSTRNRCLDIMKKHARKYEGSEGLNDEIIAGGSNQMDYIESVRWVEHFLNQLPEINRTVFHLREVEGLSFEEIQKITNNEISNIRTILSRTRKKLRKQLAQLEELEKKAIKTKTI